MNLSGHILLLSGPPGTGKTTTADHVARLPGTPKAHVHTDDFWGNIKQGHIDPWLPESHAQNRMVMRIAADVAANYARSGYFVVVDGVIGANWLPSFTPLDAPIHYIVMRTEVDEAVARCRARGGDTLSDPEVVTDLHRQFADLGRYESHVLRVDGMTPDQARDAAVEAVNSDRYRIQAHVSDF